MQKGMWAMKKLFIVLLLSLNLSGCSSNVPQKDLAGTYIAHYPFGTATLILTSDGKFTQMVSIQYQEPKTFRGLWTFNSSESTLLLRDSAVVTDGLGHLNSHWKIASHEPAFLPVEKMWFQITIDSGSQFPYVKQR